MFGSNAPVAVDAMNSGKCTMLKPTHHCLIADTVQILCEHSIPFLILMGFGVGLAHCISNANSILSAKASESPVSTKTAKAKE